MAYCLLVSIILPNIVIQMTRNTVGSGRGRETEWGERERKIVFESSYSGSGTS